MIDPLDTTDPGHLAYQQQHRARGRPTELVRMRLRYNGMTDDWMELWMLASDDLARLTSETGWTLIDERRGGP